MEEGLLVEKLCIDIRRPEGSGAVNHRVEVHATSSVHSLKRTLSTQLDVPPERQKARERQHLYCASTSEKLVISLHL